MTPTGFCPMKVVQDSILINSIKHLALCISPEHFSKIKLKPQTSETLIRKTRPQYYNNPKYSILVQNFFLNGLYHSLHAGTLVIKKNCPADCPGDQASDLGVALS